MLFFCVFLWGFFFFFFFLGGGGGAMAERAKALALIVQVGLMWVGILVAEMKGKKITSIGKPPAPNSVPYVPQHIDGRPAM